MGNKIIDSSIFQEDYQKLRHITLNPEKHTSKTAHEHTEMVVKRIKELALINKCSSEEIGMLENLGYIHDIGKISGNPHVNALIELLGKYNIADVNFINLVRYHDMSLPWYNSYKKGQPPTDKAWDKLNNSVNIFLLCLFMIADRIDNPNGWKNNEPTVWFINELKRRGLLNVNLIIDNEVI